MTDIDWVARLHECSLGKVFLELQHGVEQDVAKRESLLPTPTHYGFKMGKKNCHFWYLSKAIRFTEL